MCVVHEPCITRLLNLSLFVECLIPQTRLFFGSRLIASLRQRFDSIPFIRALTRVNAAGRGCAHNMYSIQYRRWFCLM